VNRSFHRADGFRIKTRAKDSAPTVQPFPPNLNSQIADKSHDRDPLEALPLLQSGGGEADSVVEACDMQQECVARGDPPYCDLRPSSTDHIAWVSPDWGFAASGAVVA
jgi:hypothetical protein